MVLMAFNRWVCRPRVLASVRSSEFGVLCCVYEWHAAAVEREIWKKGEVIDESLKAVLNETLGVSW
jgi:hypothetical protein